MSPIGHDTEFPRKDNAYKKKESLPFDEAQTVIWKERDIAPNEDFLAWLAFILAGFCIGFTAFCMDTVEDFLIDLAVDNAQSKIGIN